MQPNIETRFVKKKLAGIFDALRASPPVASVASTCTVDQETQVIPTAYFIPMRVDDHLEWPLL
jgi:hypothetical protein